MEGILLIAICIGASFLFSEISYRLKYPRIIGQILVGVILGLPYIKKLIFEDGIPTEIQFLSDLGIIFLLMLVGFEVNLNKLRASIGDSLNIALFSIVISFLLGFIMTLSLGYNTFMAVIIGVCFSLSAEATTLNVLIETATLNTRIGTMLLGIGIIDDLFGVMFLASVLTLLNQSSVNLMLTPAFIFVFALFTFLIFKYVPRLITFIEEEHSKVSLFSTVIVIGISITAISQLLGFGPVIGAFIAGILLRWAIKNRHVEEQNVEELKIMTFSLIIPFFFINIGLNFDIGSVIQHPIMIVLMVIVATVAKLLGSIIVSFFRKISFSQSLLIGWGLNSRGAVELVIIELARINGLITSELYSSIVIMAVITTFIFPFVLKHYLNKYPGIMDE